MANYYATIRTNYFEVTDEQAFRELIDRCSAEDRVQVFEKLIENRRHFGFGCYGSIYGISPVGDTACAGNEDADEDDEDAPDDHENDLDAFFDALQALLADGHAIIITEIGNEKLRYLVGAVTVITKQDVQFLNLRDCGLSTARIMLRNNNYAPIMEY